MVTFVSRNVLSFGNTQINLVFLSLIRTFDLTVECTLVRKYSNKFGISLTYSYLCTPDGQTSQKNRLGMGAAVGIRIDAAAVGTAPPRSSG